MHVLFAVDGEVLEVNKELAESPSLVNEDPEGKGWLIKIKFHVSVMSSTSAFSVSHFHSFPPLLSLPLSAQPSEAFIVWHSPVRRLSYGTAQ